ncbi:hypothetical protein CRE_07073 [Caenorhabditis remanei]|uniref:Uncharacterized protein n=1 Tax=Caenorhabditis remanei TaxID=31234 RepID=E3NJG5_CAERE|nr:hypothetical protein CRE_07073 [Caenorhabditis remanei]
MAREEFKKKENENDPRIQLYTALERIASDRLIYCGNVYFYKKRENEHLSDTDSVIFRQDRGTDLLGDLKGESLRMMTNEIASGCELVKVVTIASKVYGTLGRRTATGEEDYFVKAKGVTLNSETAKKVNFDMVPFHTVLYVGKFHSLCSQARASR